MAACFASRHVDWQLSGAMLRVVITSQHVVLMRKATGFVQ